MANDIVEHDDRDRSVATQSNSANLLSQIVEAAKDPAVKPEKMQAMADLAIQLQDREMQQEFNRDMTAAIMEMPIITKAGRIVIKDKNTGEIVQSTPFAKFEDLDRVVKPIAKRHNLSYKFDVGGSEDNSRLLVSITLMHTNGYREKSDRMPLPLETSGSKNNVQGAGSTNTYGKRYVLQNTFAISTEGEDDDGNLGNTVTMPQERQNTVLDEAAAAFEAGTYNDWYWNQSPKDRAFLVSSGKHAEYGGTPALSAPKPDPEPDVREKVDPEPEPQPEPEDQARLNWVDRYVEKVAATQSLTDLADLQAKHAENLTKIRDRYEDLAEKIKAAHDAAFTRLQKAEEGNQDGSENKDDLFGGDQ